ncbi:MAG TPA: pirin family protein [Alphaproteobacteria bacterium]|nr:pirin family protein [Alphaproteobacteria bacterium]
MERIVDRIETPRDLGPNEQVQAKRSILNGPMERLSPFLRLSEDWFAAPGGFETHPHRGMQTVTLVLEGALHHRDHTGADGVLRAGDVQWMTAGRGVLHSEMPHERELAHTLQLWLNLPAAAKMIPARYVDQPLASVPVRRLPGAEVRVYAGASGEVRHPHGSHWPMMLLDIAIEAGQRLDQELPADYRAFAYVLAGAACMGGNRKRIAAPQIAWLEPTAASGTDTIAIEAEAPFRCLLFAGPPMAEPVVAYGPFVMNTVEEIKQAIADYQSDRLTA